MTEVKDISGYMATNKKAEEEFAMNQSFKGTVLDVPEKFPKELGAKHPFNFKEVEDAYKKIGLVNGAVNKFTDNVLGDFTVRVDNENAQKIIDSFLEDSDFITVLRSWINEGILKGNGFMELDLKAKKVRVMNANSMYVRRTKKGIVKEYNQFAGQIDKFISGTKKVNPFKPNQIAHLLLNKIPNEPYGLGYVYPNLVAFNNYAGAELDLHKLMSRKAGAPYHIKVGIPGQATSPTAVDDVSEKMQYMNNRTEWVTDANVDIKYLDFSGLGDNLTKLSDHDVQQISFGMQIPMVLFGLANVAEGLAKEQSDAFDKLISSIRLVAEKVIKEQILVPILRENNLDQKIEFTWELKSEEAKNEKIKAINEALKNPFISDELRASLEIEYAKIFELDDVLEILTKPAEAQKIRQENETRRQEEEEIEQPEVPGVKPTANSEAKPKIKEKIKVVEKKNIELTEDAARDMTLAEYVNITELDGFNYTDYLIKIIQNLKTFKFEDLLAKTERDIAEGLLPHNDIEKLRVVLKDGFRKNKTIRQIEKEIKQSIPLKDRVAIQEDGSEKLTLSKEARPLTIARTETVRLANMGLKDLYKENNVDKYRYLAALDERTTEICQELNGQVFLTKDGTPGVNMPPMHVNCRSTIVGIID